MEEMNSRTAEQEKNVESVKQIFELIHSDGEDFSVLDEVVAEDYVQRNPLAGKGREGLRAYFKKLIPLPDSQDASGIVQVNFIVRGGVCRPPGDPQAPPVGLQAGALAREQATDLAHQHVGVESGQLVHRDDQRRIADDPPPPVCHGGQFADRLQSIPAAGLCVQGFGGFEVGLDGNCFSAGQDSPARADRHVIRPIRERGSACGRASCSPVG